MRVRAACAVEQHQHRPRRKEILLASPQKEILISVLMGFDKQVLFSSLLNFPSQKKIYRNRRSFFAYSDP